MKPDRIVHSGTQRLAVYTWGEAAGRPTLVLVHGYPDAASVWQDTARQLARDFHVVAYDVRGAGHSDRPARTADYALAHLVEDLAAVLDAVSPGRPVHLVGHDWGAIQSWEAVSGERLQGRIASFTSISGPCIDHAGHWMRRCLRTAARGGLHKLARQLRHSWYIAAFQLPGLAPAAWRLGLDRAWPRIMQRVGGSRAQEFSATRREDGSSGVQLYRANFPQRLLRPRERPVALPVQVIVPDADPLASRDLLDELPRWVPQLWVRHVAAGHWLPVTHAEDLAALIGEFAGCVDSGQETPALRDARYPPARTQSMNQFGSQVLPPSRETV